MNIYIGNFSYDVTEDDLREAFAAFGRVESIKIIKDKYTGNSRGFGFVEMPDKTEAQAAMNGITEIKGKRITINEARPQVQSSPRGEQRGYSGYKNFGRRERRYS